MLLVNIGLEIPRQDSNPLSETLEKPQIPDKDGAISDALSANSDPIDPDLRRLIDAWPTLPEALRAGILAMVAAAPDR
jgi:hypothetical protein